MSGSERSNDTAGHARLAGLAGFLKRHLEACLRGDLQKSRSIRAANKPRDFSASPSVYIRNPWLKSALLQFRVF
jgi:hypothetical protein